MNVFKLAKKDLVPLRVSKVRCQFVLYLSLLSEVGTHHYVLMTDLKPFINFIRNRQSSSRDGKCRNCFHVCISNESLQNHKINCYGNEAAMIVLPDDKKKLHQSKSIETTWFVTLVIFFDTEALLDLTHTCASTSNASGHMKLEKHIPSGYEFIVVEHGNYKMLPHRIKRQYNSLEDSIDELEKNAKDIYRDRSQKNKASRQKNSVAD